MSVVVKLAEGADVFTGWTDVVIKTSLDDACTTFDLGIAVDDVDKLPSTGDKVKIEYNGKLVTVGYIDSIRESYTATDHYIQVSGRSLSKDLVDCSASVGEWFNAKISTIATALTKPYNVKVTVENDIQIPQFTVEKNSSETVIAVLQKLAAIGEMFVTDDERGNIVMTTAGSAGNGGEIITTPNNKDHNVLSANSVHDESNSFSHVIVRSQVRGTDEFFGKAANQIVGQAKDTINVKRYRPLVLDATTSMPQTQADRYAAWQLANNTGKSIEYTYTVQGWEHKGKLWAKNTIPTIKDSIFRFDTTNGAKMVIAAVQYQIDAGKGTTTTLTINPIGAYVPPPLSKPTKLK